MSEVVAPAATAREDEQGHGGPEPVGASASADASASSSTLVPRGARCAVHEGRDACFACTRCGTFGCDACVFSRIPNKEVCTSCGAMGLGEPIPWERRAELGRMRAFWQTTRVVMRSPREFYRTPATEEGLLWPGVYGLTVYTLGQVVSLLGMVVLLLLAALVTLLVGVDPLVPALLAGYAVFFLVVMVPISLVQSPLTGLLGIVAGGGLTHLTLKALKRANASFEETARVVSFANAPYVLYFIPCVGPFVAWLWMLRTETIGIREVHRITTDRALIAVLTYRIVFVVLGVTLYAGFIALMVYLQRGTRGGGF